MAGKSTRETQLAVLGGGPGGYAVAFHAAELGMKVTMINTDAEPGGVCLHRGCIPSKSLLHVAKLLNEAKDVAECGITFQDPQIDLDKLRAWKDGVVGQLTGGLAQLAGRRNVELVHARGSFIDSHTIHVHSDKIDETIACETAILATGSLPAMPGPLKVGDPRVMDSTDALRLDEVPGRLLIVGGGYIGLEMGTVYAALGSAVTVVELTDGLLPGVDRDLVRVLEPRLKAAFNTIHLNTKVERMEPRDDGILAVLRGEGVEPEQVFDRVLVAVGRWPSSTGIGLENTRVEVDAKGFVTVDARRRTTDPAIYAIGDVTGEPMVAHKASREGKVAVEAILGKNSEFDNVAIPAVVFTDPELAWCGLTETQAKAQGVEIAVARFPWAASGRAKTLGRPDGVTKLILDPQTERVLGMGVAGSGAGELIAEGVLAVEMAATATDIAESIHPHPTLSESVMETAEAFFGHATHLFRAKR